VDPGSRIGRESLRDVDANLLIHLHLLLEERSLTHAGERMAMSQSAMSGALSRLRKHFGDELLVRAGGGLELTELAQRIRPAVAAAVEAAGALLGDPRDFDPAASEKRFTFSLSEYAMTVLAQPLNDELAARAPSCSISFDSLPESRLEFEGRLLRRDLVISPRGFELPGSRQPVFTDQLVCLVADSNARLHNGELTLEDLACLPHAATEFGLAEPVRRPLEVKLEASGLGGRNVQITVASLLALPYAIAGTDLVCFVPRRLAMRCLSILGLAIARTPLEPMLMTEVAHWHPRRAADPAGIWLRRLLHDVAIRLEDDI
jgi:DNA-binding transcriptional LysR family regulator